MNAEDYRLETNVRKANGIPILEVSGEIDLSTAPEFKRSLNQVIDEGHQDIVVDMKDVTYMDSSGFGTLLGITKRLRPEGGSVSLIGCNDAIQRMLRITRLNTVFGMFDQEEEALSAIKS
jgi:anti-sigma B factor antagonist